jgi:hypothetical protein
MRPALLISMFTFTLSLLSQGLPAPAQTAKSGSYILMKVGGGFYATSGDLAKRYSQFASIPVSLGYKSKSNLSFSLNYSPILGNNVNITGLFGDMLGPTGEILDQNGFPTIIRYYMRGFSAGATVGKIFPAGKSSKHGSFEISAGAGMLQHYIKMQFDAGRTPQLEGLYTAGYDRLTNGLQLSQHFRWQYLNTETLSVYAGIDVCQGFTQNRRSWNFSEMAAETKVRKDIYFGLSAGIIIPVTLKAAASESKYFD